MASSQKQMQQQDWESAYRDALQGNNSLQLTISHLRAQLDETNAALQAKTQQAAEERSKFKAQRNEWKKWKYWWYHEGRHQRSAKASTSSAAVQVKQSSSPLLEMPMTTAQPPVLSEDTQFSVGPYGLSAVQLQQQQPQQQLRESTSQRKHFSSQKAKVRSSPARSARSSSATAPSQPLANKDGQHNSQTQSPQQQRKVPTSSDTELSPSQKKQLSQAQVTEPAVRQVKPEPMSPSPVKSQAQAQAQSHSQSRTATRSPGSHSQGRCHSPSPAKVRRLFHEEADAPSTILRSPSKKTKRSSPRRISGGAKASTPVVPRAAAQGPRSKRASSILKSLDRTRLLSSSPQTGPAAPSTSSGKKRKFDKLEDAVDAAVGRPSPAGADVTAEQVADVSYEDMLATIRKKRKQELKENPLKYKGKGAYARGMPLPGEQPINAQYAIDPTKNGGMKQAYNQVVRKQEERKKMHGGGCSCCNGFAEKAADISGIDVKAYRDKHSKHRYYWEDPESPPDFWNMGFPDTPQVERINKNARELEKEKRARIEAEAQQGNGRYVRRP